MKLRSLLFRVPALLFCLLLSCCVDESLEYCINYYLHVKVINANGTDIDAGKVMTSTSGYLFDGEGYVRTLQMKSNEVFYFGMERNQSFTAAVWGNMKDNGLGLSVLQKGMSLQNAVISARRSAAGYCLPVNDLFYGSVTINGASTRAVRQDTLEIPVKRITAGLSMRILHLEEYFRAVSVSDSLYIVVHGGSGSVDFSGKPATDAAAYLAVAQRMGHEDEWRVPHFRMLATGGEGHASIEVRRGGTLLFTVSGSNALRLQAGVENSVLVDCRYATISISVSVKPWEEDQNNVGF